MACATDTFSSNFSSYVELATRRIAAVAKTSKIVVEKSTVPCRTAESMRTILEANSHEPECKFVICRHHCWLFVANILI